MKDQGLKNWSKNTRRNSAVKKPKEELQALIYVSE
jgi:hypothetical protein